MVKHYKFFSILLIVAFLLSLAACGGSSSNDEAFINNIQKGLEARWKISSKSPQIYSSTVEQKTDLTNCINAELDAIGAVENYSFADPELQAIAEAYVAALNSQLEALNYLGVDENKYVKLFSSEGYNVRAKSICRLAEDYGLSVSEKNSAYLNEFVSKGRILLDLDEQVASMESILSGDISLEAVSGAEYECVVTNTTQYDLSGATIDFNLYDDNNVLVRTATSYLNTWPAGSTNKCTIYVSESFSKVEACVSLFSATLFDYLKTESHPIEYINELKIDISLATQLPCSVDYSSYSKLVTTCSVTSFDYEVGYWTNGKASVKLLLAGTKVFDDRGDSYSRGAKVGWKLYDEDGVVIDSGTITSSNIQVGESFVDALSYANNVAPGNYTLELLNVS